MEYVQDMVLAHETRGPIAVGSPEWVTWLRETTPSSFSLRAGEQTVTLRSERRGAASFWYAYHKQQGRLRKVYVGSSSALTRERLATALSKVLEDVPVQPPAKPAVRLVLLGVPALSVAGQALPVSAKTVVLLAYLALCERPPTREHLCALLWPDSAQDAARKNLQNMLWQLRARRAQHGDLVQIRPDGRVTLAADIWVDARAFLHAAQQPSEDEQHLAQALALYGGPFLDGVTSLDGATTEQWLRDERERFAQVCLRLLSRRIEALQAAGAWAEMLEATRHALAVDSLQEPLHRFAMVAYARLGQRTEALRQYEQVRALLNAELGIAPLPETDALREAIARGSLAALPHAGRQALPPQESTPPVLPFVGRDGERAVLDAALHGVLQQQRAQVVALTGELGIGKSRLWREWSLVLPAATTVVEYRCLESTQAIPLAPVTRLVADAFARPGAPRLDTLWLAELSRLAPALKLHYPHLPAPVSLPPDLERGRLFEACLHALHALGKPPLVVFVDDLQWADQATLAWLAYCVEQVKHLPVLLLVAYRLHEMTAALSHLLAAWQRGGLVRQVALGPLSVDETATVVAMQKPHEARAWDAAALHRHSAGNPYYLGELLQAGDQGLPTSLTTLVQSRLARLPAVARQVLQTAAILDPDCDVDLLRDTSGRSDDETLDALDVLVETAFLREAESATVRQDELAEQPMRYLFAHPFVATVLRQDLSSARRAALHRRAAAALVKRYGAHLPPLAGRLFKHYEGAGQRRQAAQYAEMAGHYALGAASAVQAEDFFRKALELEATVERYMGLASAQMRTGQVEAARVAFEQALRIAVAQKSAPHILAILGAYIETYLLVNQFAQAIHRAEQPDVQAYLSILDPATQAIVRGLIRVMKHRLVTPSLQNAEQECVNLLRLLEATPNQLLAAQAYQMVATTFAEQGKWREAVEAYRSVEQAARALGDIFHVVLARNDVAYHMILLGQVGEARVEVEAALALVKRHKLHAARFYVYSTYGELWLAEGAWTEAERWWKRALAQVERRSDAQAQAAELYANLGRAARGRGDLTAAIRLLERARNMMQQEQVPFQSAQIDLWLADLYSVSGKQSAARALLDQLGPSLHESGWGELQRRAAQVAGRLADQGRPRKGRG